MFSTSCDNIHHDVTTSWNGLKYKKCNISRLGHDFSMK